MSLVLLVLLAAGDGSALAAQPGGWVDILPAPGLAGWTRVEPISTAGLISRVDPAVAVWVVDRRRGVLECRGHFPPAKVKGGKEGSHEMLRYDRDLGDFIFHVEWRFVDPGRPGWNSGIYARCPDDLTIWHQAQVGNAKAYWFGDTPGATGKVVRRKLDPPADARVKPAGQWNSYEITARGDKLTLWANGAVVSEMDGVRVRRGHIGLEAEYHHIEFRNLKLKELSR